MKKLNSCVDSYFLSPSECSSILSSIYSFRENNSKEHVIDGKLISTHLPVITKLWRDVQKMVDEFSGSPATPLLNSKAAVKIKITPPGEADHWHYSENAITAILHLNEIQGGEAEIFDGYRIFLDSPELSKLQRTLDRVFLAKISRWIFSGKRIVVQPRAGQLLLMRANRCLHAVRPVRGTTDRISIVFAFDTPGKNQTVETEGLIPRRKSA